MRAKLKIGVLETGRPPVELAGEFPDYPTMVKTWLAPLDAEFTSYATLDGVLSASPLENDAWVITGSRFAAYEDHDWIAPLEQFIRDCAAAPRKMIGICFGHQIIAQALGGKVEKYPKGWSLGVRRYQVTGWPAALGPAPDHLAFQAYHQDQVVELPPDAHRIARSDFCENAALWYPGFALTVQGHPEFPAAYVEALLKIRRGTVLSPEAADQGLMRVNMPNTRAALALLIRDHLDDI
jgi:GMP synthase-like glutamine amidotransferase